MHVKRSRDQVFHLLLFYIRILFYFKNVGAEFGEGSRTCKAIPIAEILLKRKIACLWTIKKRRKFYGSKISSRYPRSNNTLTKQDEKTIIAHNTEKRSVFHHERPMTTQGYQSTLFTVHGLPCRPGVLKKVLKNKLKSKQQVMERKIVHHINLRQKIRHKEYTIQYARESLRISARKRVE